MGKWDRRRGFYRHRPPPSPPRYNLHERLPDVHEDGVPLWEKKYCTVIGRVPWRKIVETKSFMRYTHGNVFSWDDSAAEQAFQDAKRLYWAKINGISSDISFPDADMYIEEIDWNPDIDHELIKDLERAYFVPDDEDKESDEEQKNNRVQNLSSLPFEESDRNIEVANNLWTCNDNAPDRAASKDQDGWGKWADEIQDSRDAKNNSDPWESYCSQTEVKKHKTWGDCSDDKQWISNNSRANRSRDWWTAVTHQNLVSQDGCSNWANHSRGWNQREQNKLFNEVSPWKSDVLKESCSYWKTRHGESHRDPLGSKQQGDHYNWSRSLHYKQTDKAQDAWSGGCRKRDSSHQYGTDQRNFRPRHDYDQDGRYHQGGNGKKRVGFTSDNRMRRQ